MIRLNLIFLVGWRSNTHLLQKEIFTEDTFDLHKDSTIEYDLRGKTQILIIFHAFGLRENEKRKKLYTCLLKKLVERLENKYTITHLPYFI